MSAERQGYNFYNYNSKIKGCTHKHLLGKCSLNTRAHRDEGYILAEATKFVT